MFEEEKNKEKLIYKASLLLENRLYDKAIKYYLNLLSGHPDDPVILTDLAFAYSQKNETEKSLIIINQVLEFNSEYIPALILLTELYLYSINDYENAKQTIFKVLELNPENATAFSLLAEILYYNNELEECYKACNKALEMNPYNHMTLMTLGLYYSAKKNWKESEACFLRSLSINANSYEVMSNYAELLDKRANINAALKLIKTAVKICPDNVYLQKQLKQYYIKNHILVSPLYYLTKGKILDSKIYFGYWIVLIAFCFIFVGLDEIGFVSYTEQILGNHSNFVYGIIAFIIVIIPFPFMIYYSFIEYFINAYYNYLFKKGEL